MDITANTIIGLVMAGLLSLLWYDLRSLRKNGFLTEEKHELLCANTTLRFEKKIDDMKDEIIKEIRSNGRQ